MTTATRPYLFYDAVVSICTTCYRKIDGKVVFEEGRVWMLKAVMGNEGEADVVQISGGEPTIHPDFFAILDAAKRRPIRHLMVNTNGVRIARDAEFAKRLASYKPLFEIYLQFDSLRPKPLEVLRGAHLRDVPIEAIQRLNDVGASTTLVVTLQRGLND